MQLQHAGTAPHSQSHSQASWSAGGGAAVPAAASGAAAHAQPQPGRSDGAAAAAAAAAAPAPPTSQVQRGGGPGASCQSLPPHPVRALRLLHLQFKLASTLQRRLLLLLPRSLLLRWPWQRDGFSLGRLLKALAGIIVTVCGARMAASVWARRAALLRDATFQFHSHGATARFHLDYHSSPLHRALVDAAVDAFVRAGELVLAATQPRLAFNVLHALLWHSRVVRGVRYGEHARHTLDVHLLTGHQGVCRNDEASMTGAQAPPPGLAPESRTSRPRIVLLDESSASDSASLHPSPAAASRLAPMSPSAGAATAHTRSATSPALSASASSSTAACSSPSHFTATGATACIDAPSPASATRTCGVSVRPPQHRGSGSAASTLLNKPPVILFVHGGAWAWGSGSLYSAVSRTIADSVGAPVVTMTYRAYPHGNMADMADDVRAAVAWVHAHADEYSWDANRCYLVGHSAGAHLCVQAAITAAMEMREQTSGSRRCSGGHGQVVLSPGAWTDAAENATGGGRASALLREHTPDPHSIGSASAGAADGNFSDATPWSARRRHNWGNATSPQPAGSPPSGDAPPQALQGVPGRHGTDGASSTSVDVSGGAHCSSHHWRTGAAAATPSAAAGAAPATQLRHAEPDVNSPTRRRTGGNDRATQALPGVRAIIAISGVYHIADHFDHEANARTVGIWPLQLKGVATISPMAPAAQGQANFHSYSPTLLLRTLSRHQVAALPRCVLLHGDADGTVPLASSRKFYSAAAAAGAAATLTEVAGMGHADMLIDMMRGPTVGWSQTVVAVIRQAMVEPEPSDAVADKPDTACFMV